jgi:hypothetical protein
MAIRSPHWQSTICSGDAIAAAASDTKVSGRACSQNSPMTKVALSKSGVRLSCDDRRYGEVRYSFPQPARSEASLQPQRCQNRFVAIGAAGVDPLDIARQAQPRRDVIIVEGLQALLVLQ